MLLFQTTQQVADSLQGAAEKPKKNAYFADQIRFLEKLIINAKSK